MNVTYQVRHGFDIAEVAADVARDQWDQTPSNLRTGAREGSFILWSRSEHGYLTAPVIFRRIVAEQPAGARASSMLRQEPTWRQVRTDVRVEDDRREDDPSPRSGATRAALEC
jgi:hypothetical protein